MRRIWYDTPLEEQITIAADIVNNMEVSSDVMDLRLFVREVEAYFNATESKELEAESNNLEQETRPRRLWNRLIYENSSKEHCRV